MSSDDVTPIASIVSRGNAVEAQQYLASVSDRLTAAVNAAHNAAHAAPHCCVAPCGAPAALEGEDGFALRVGLRFSRAVPDARAFFLQTAYHANHSNRDVLSHYAVGRLSPADEAALLLEAIEEAVAHSRVQPAKGSELETEPIVLHPLDGSAGALWRRTKAKSARPFLAVQPIVEYFGPEVALYFEWVNFYNAWLVVPGVVGTGVFCTRYFLDTTVLYPLYSAFVVLWSVLFVRYWERRQWVFAAAHGCSLQRAAAGGTDFLEPPRAGYRATATRANPVTGAQERYYPAWKRRLQQPVSWLVTLLMLGFCICVQVCSLNLQGYMSKEQHTELEIPFFDQFSEPGRIFDVNSNMGNVPVVLHVVLVLLLNTVFRSVAGALTAWENYRSREEHENAIIVKRVFFEFIDCFAVLFYVAFYRLDMPQLRLELVSLYSVDQLRRLSCEVLLPYLYAKRRQISQKVKAAKATVLKKKSDREPAPVSDASMDDADEVLPEYEGFDDYLELVMQFGYITLFAAAFPLAAGLSFVGNLVEIRSDCFKLFYIARRPAPRRVASIGPWLTVLRMFAFGAVVTNSLLFGFTSHNQMRYYFPSLFAASAAGEMLQGEGRVVVALIFVLEHVVMLLAGFLYWYIPAVPHRVAVTLQKAQLAAAAKPLAEA
jgi:hypothetical protein